MTARNETSEEEDEEEPVYVTYNKPRPLVKKAINLLEEEEKEQISWCRKYTLRIEDRKVAKRLSRAVRRTETRHPHLLKSGVLPPQDLFNKIPGKTKTVAGLTRTIFYDDRWELYAQKFYSLTKPTGEKEIVA